MSSRHDGTRRSNKEAGADCPVSEFRVFDLDYAVLDAGNQVSEVGGCPRTWRANWSLLTLRTLCAPLTLRPLRPLRPLCAPLTLWPLRPLRPGVALGRRRSSLASRPLYSPFPLRAFRSYFPFLSLWARYALLPLGALRAFRPNLTLYAL